MTLRPVCLMFAAMLAGAPALQGQAQYVPIPNASSCRDGSSDGTRAVGVLSSGAGGGCYFWDWQTAPTPISIGGMNATAASDDGSVIAGTIWDGSIPSTHPSGFGASVAAIWTQASGWVSLGYVSACDTFTSSANDISGDGTMVVGHAFVNGCESHAALWTIDYSTPATPVVTGPTLLDASLSPNGKDLQAYAIAKDKSLAVGYARSASWNRSPATWDPNNPTTSGAHLDPTAFGECFGVNDDGGIICGRWVFGAASFQTAFYMTDGVTPINLGPLNPGIGSRAEDVSDDGGRICGYDVNLGPVEAWMSFQGGKPIGMSALLTGLGVAGVPSLPQCYSMSADGTVIVGDGLGVGGWIAVVPSILPASVTGLPGCGQANPNSLVSDGTLPAPGATVTLLQDLGPTAVQPAGSTALLLISTQPDVNYPCGTPVAQTGLVMGPMQLVVNLAFTSFVAYPLLWNFPGDVKAWPLTIPPVPAAIGFKLYFQGAFTPPSFPGKSTLTEGLEMTIGLP